MSKSRPLIVTFKAKVRRMVNMDGTVAYRYVDVPKTIGCKHCDMQAFRDSAKFGPYANSDFFPGMLRHAVEQVGVKPGGRLKLDALPDGVTVDESGFLAVVSIVIPDNPAP